MVLTNRPARSVKPSFFSISCVLGIIWVTGVPFAKGSPEPIEVEFLPLANRAFAVASSDPKLLVSVYVGSAPMTKVHRLNGGVKTELPVVGHDKVTRLCFFQNPNPVGSSSGLWRGNYRNENPQSITAVSPAGKTSCRFERWVSQVGDKVLPLSLLEISFEENVPQAGTPLVDSTGKIIGLILQPASARRAYAIPAQAVRRVHHDISEHRKLVRGWLGISLSTESTIPRITRVWPGSPAEKAGILENDILLKAGPYNTDRYPDAVNALFYTIPGRTTSIEIRRDNERLPRDIVPVAQKPGG